MEVDVGLVGHPHVPIGRSDVVGDKGLFGGVRSDLEREGLATECGKSLVRGSPVVAHAYPAGFGALHPHA